MAKKKKQKQAKAGIFQIYSELDKEKKHTYTGASKRIPICVRDYKQFLLKGTASKKLTQMVETLSQETDKTFEEVVESLQYDVLQEVAPEAVQEAKDNYLQQQEPTRDEQIARLLQEGMTQAAIAQEVGCSRGTVARVKRKQE